MLLCEVASDPLSEKRVSSTTHELYISEPYFTESQATRTRTALIDVAATPEATPNSSGNTLASNEEVTIEEAIHNRLTDFFDKRKASGDAKPCGPRDMVPIDGGSFGIPTGELKDES